MNPFRLLFLFLPLFLLSHSTEAQVDLSNPNSTIYTHLYFLQEDSYEPAKAAKTIYGLDGKEAEDAAIKLKKILDGKGLKVDFRLIPKNPNYMDTTSGELYIYRYQPFPVRMPQIELNRIDTNWYYADETVKQINAIYRETFGWSLGGIALLLPDAISHDKILGIEVWQYLALLIIVIASIIIFFLLRKIVVLILKRIEKIWIRMHSESTDLAIRKLSRPITLLIIFSLIEKVLPSLMLSLDSNTFLFLALSIFKTVFWIYVFLKLVKVLVSIYETRALATEGKLDDQLAPILNNFLSVIVVIIGLFRLMIIFGIDIKTVIMGASIGGLALALASQDTVKNLLGTVMIFLDKPFHIGDWIEADGVEGTVEEVRFRSSRIRAADTSIYQIPNSKLSEMTINNKGLRRFRRYTTDLGIRYDTPPELIEAFTHGIEKICIAHPNINNENYKIVFSGFGESVLTVMVNVYFEILDWGPVQTAKHQFHIALVQLAKELNVEFAFPTQTIVAEQFPEKSPTKMNYNIDPEYMDTAVQKVLDKIKLEDLLPPEEKGQKGGVDD